LISHEAHHHEVLRNHQPKETNIMKTIRITTWLASALFAAGLVFAQDGSNQASGARDGASATGTPSGLLCKQKRSGGGKAKGQGKQKRGGARDGTGDGCPDSALAGRGAGKGKGRGNGDGNGQGNGQGKQKRARDGSGEDCQDGALVQCGNGSGKGCGNGKGRRGGNCDGSGDCQVA
jgi:hypothetical protein